MTTVLQISCINKSDRFNPHEHIVFVGGVRSDGSRWRMTQPDAVAAIEAGACAFFVNVQSKRVGVIVARSQHGHKYLKTESDGEQPNNLLSLPECPK